MSGSVTSWCIVSKSIEVLAADKHDVDTYSQFHVKDGSPATYESIYGIIGMDDYLQKEVLFHVYTIVDT